MSMLPAIQVGSDALICIQLHVIAATIDTNRRLMEASTKTQAAIGEINPKNDLVPISDSEHSYSLTTRARAFLFLKIAYTLGTGRYIITPLANAAYDFAAVRLTVTAASSLMVRSLPWVVMTIALLTLGLAFNDLFELTLQSAKTSILADPVFKAIRTIKVLEQKKAYLRDLQSTLEQKLQEINAFAQTDGAPSEEKISSEKKKLEALITVVKASQSLSEQRIRTIAEKHQLYKYEQTNGGTEVKVGLENEHLIDLADKIG